MCGNTFKCNLFRTLKSMKKITPLIWLGMLLLPPIGSAAQYGGGPLLFMPQLLSCDKQPFEGNVRSITEKQNDPLNYNKMVATAYMEFDEESRMQFMDHKRYGIHYYYHYNTKGQLHSAAGYLNGAPLDSIVYAYHDDGKVRATLHYGPDRMNLKQVKQTHYDSAGMPVRLSARNVEHTEIEEVIGVGENYIDISWRLDRQPPQVFRYPFDRERGCVIRYDRRIEDASGEKVMEIAEGSGKNNRISIQEYEYDEMGNWTVCRYYNVKAGKKVKPGDMYLIRAREIKYR